MRGNTHLSNSLDAIDSNKIKYDKNVKELFADIQILSRIVEHTVDEVKDFTVDEIMRCIDRNDIEIGTVPISPGLTNLGKVESVQTEDSAPNEGYITFDIRFPLYCGSERFKIIINVEAQKSTDPSMLQYHLENRVIYYLARMISSQKEKEFFHSDYDNIKKVYSIWICMDKDNDSDSITEISLQSKTRFGNPINFPEIDKMCGIIIRIRSDKNMNESKNKLIALLEDLLRKEPPNIKKEKLINSYGMTMTPEMERRLQEVCNLSHVIDEEGREKGQLEKLIQVVNNMLNEGSSLDFITRCCGETTEYIQKLIEENSLPKSVL